MSKLLLVGLACLGLAGCSDQPGATATGDERAVIGHNRRAQNTANPAEICLSNYSHTLPCSDQLKPKPENKQLRWALIRNEILPIEQ